MQKIPRNLDDAQRAVLGALGAGLMLGGIAWIGTVNSAWPLRVVPAVAMFVVGAILLIWVLPGHHSRRATLDKAIADGRFLAAMDSSFAQHQEWCEWSRSLREPFGLQVAKEFAESELSRDVADAIKEQVTYLEGLRKRT